MHNDLQTSIDKFLVELAALEALPDPLHSRAERTRSLLASACTEAYGCGVRDGAAIGRERAAADAAAYEYEERRRPRERARYEDPDCADCGRPSDPWSPCKGCGAVVCEDCDTRHTGWCRQCAVKTLARARAAEAYAQGARAPWPEDADGRPLGVMLPGDMEALARLLGVEREADLDGSDVDAFDQTFRAALSALTGDTKGA